MIPSRRYKPGGYRVWTELCRERELPPFRCESPQDLADFIRRGTNVDREAQEVVGVVLLDGRHNINGWEIVARGRINSSAVEPREVFRPAILTPTAAIVLFHNHPSGDPEPSEDDARLTNRLKRCAETLGMELLDHIVFGSDGRYVSFRERGII